MKKHELMSTKIFSDTFTELRKRLNGECGNSCPLLILIEAHKKLLKNTKNYLKNMRFISVKIVKIILDGY